MFTLNIYGQANATNPQAQYLFSITKSTRKQCLALAQAKYSDLAWDWDDKNYVKRKKYNSDPSSAINVNLIETL